MHRLQPSSGFDALALQVSERSRARTLLDSLVATQAKIREGISPELRGQERKLQQQINQREGRRLESLHRKDGQPQAEALNNEVLALLSEYESLQLKIRTNGPYYAALTQPQPLSLKEIQQQVLDGETVLLEYVLGQERSFLWAVTSTATNSYELPQRAEIETAAREVYALLTARNRMKEGETDAQRSRRIARADAEYSNSAAALSRMVLGPAAGQLGAKRLLIVADGPLQYVPFAALPLPLDDVARRPRGNPASDRSQPRVSVLPRPGIDFVPLVARHEIISLPSASVLAVLRKELAPRPPAGKTVAVLADPVFQPNDPRVKQGLARPDMPPPLRGQSKIRNAKSERNPDDSNGDRRLSDFPERVDVARSARDSGVMSFQRLRFSRTEADAIAALVAKEEGLKATDFAASKFTAMRADLADYRILHFATHGLLNSRRPVLSGVVLSLVGERGEPQDGFPRLHEIYNLKLDADLVVLSSCQTAPGKDVRGEGLIGLTRGFMYAGAARVLASLWNVKDRSTADLMKRFYRELVVKGLQPAAALRQAQLSMWKEHRAAYDWAAFTLQGEWK